jgi:hypothetical protein
LLHTVLPALLVDRTVTSSEETSGKKWRSLRSTSDNVHTYQPWPDGSFARSLSLHGSRYGLFTVAYPLPTTHFCNHSHATVCNHISQIAMGKQYNAFPCPLLLTSVIFFIQWMFGLCASELFPRYSGVAVVKNMTWKTYLGEITHDLLVLFR